MPKMPDMTMWRNIPLTILRDKVTEYLVDNCIQVEQSDDSE